MTDQPHLRITRFEWPADSICKPPRDAKTVYQVHYTGWGNVSPEFDSETKARDWAALECPELTVAPDVVVCHDRRAGNRSQPNRQ